MMTRAKYNVMAAVVLIIASQGCETPTEPAIENESGSHRQQIVTFIRPAKYVCFMSLRSNDANPSYHHYYVSLDYGEETARTPSALVRIRTARDGQMHKAVNCFVPGTVSGVEHALSQLLAAKTNFSGGGGATVLDRALAAAVECNKPSAGCGVGPISIECGQGFDPNCDIDLATRNSALVNTPAVVLIATFADAACDNCLPPQPDGALGQTQALIPSSPPSGLTISDTDLEVTGNRWNCRGRTDYPHWSAGDVSVHASTYNCNVPQPQVGVATSLWFWSPQLGDFGWVGSNNSTGTLVRQRETVVRSACRTGLYMATSYHGVIGLDLQLYTTNTSSQVTVTCRVVDPEPPPPSGGGECDYQIIPDPDGCTGEGGGGGGGGGGDSGGGGASEWEYLCETLLLDPGCYDVYVDDVYEETICCGEEP